MTICRSRRCVGAQPTQRPYFSVENQVSFAVTRKIQGHAPV